jgi:hypothetical protein
MVDKTHDAMPLIVIATVLQIILISCDITLNTYSHRCNRDFYIGIFM